MIHGWPRRWGVWLLVWVAGAAGGALVAPTLAAFSSMTSNPGNSFEAAVTFPTPQWVKEIGTSSCGGTSSVITVPAGGVAAGNTVIVRLVVRSSALGVVSASDSKGSTYSNDLDFTGTTMRVVVFSASIDTALVPGNTITVSHPTGESTGAVASEFSGVAASNRVDTSGIGTADSTNPAASVTTVHPRDLLVGVVGNRNNRAYMEAADWTLLTHLAMACGGAPGNADNHSAWRIASSPGLYSYAPTFSPGDRWAAAVVAYKPAP